MATARERLARKVVERQLGGAAVSQGGDDYDDAGSVRTLGADTVATGVSGAPRKRKSKAQDAKEQQEKAAKIARQSRSVCCFGTCGKKLTASDKRENKICCPVHYKPWAIGYAYMTEEEAGTKYGDDPSFRKAFDDSSKYLVDNEIEVDRFSPKQVEDSSEQKASCQRILGFWTRPEIFNKFKYMPEQLGYKCFKLWDEFGTPTLGVLTSDLEGAPRTFTFEFSKMLSLSNLLARPASTIHDGQCDLVYESATGKFHGQLDPSGSTIISMSTLLSRAAKKEADKKETERQKQEEEDAELRALSLHDDSSQLDDGRGPSTRFEADEFEKDADILSVGAEPAAVTPEKPPSSGQALRALSGTKSLDSLPDPSVQECMPDVADLLKSDPIKAKWVLQLSKVNFTKALAGRTPGGHGRERNTLKGYITEAENMGREEAVMMKEHHDLHKQCEQFSTEQGWLNASDEELGSFAADLKKHNVDLPTSAKLSCMSRALRDWTQLQHSIEDKAAQLLSMITPWPSDGGSVDSFDPENPLARHIEGSPSEKMERLRECLISKILAPMIRDGAPSHDSLLRVVHMVLDMITAASDSKHIDFEVYEDHADQMMSMLRAVLVVMETDTVKLKEYNATSKDYDRLQESTGQGGMSNVLTAMKQISHYKALLGEFIRTRKDCETYLPRLEEYEQKLSSKTEYSFQDDMTMIMQAWNLIKQTHGKLRKGQGTKLRSQAEQATLQITGSLPDMIEQGRFPPERSAELKGLVDITSQMSFALPKRDLFSSYVVRIQQENNIGNHVGTMIKCMRAFQCDAERETRAADIKSLHAQVKAYIEFGVQSLPEDLSDSIDQFMVKVMIAMGSGEDMNMIQAVLEYIRLVCDLGLDLIALKGDLSEQMVQFKVCLTELSNIQWDLVAVVGFKKHGATAEAMWQRSKGTSELGQFVAASAAMTEASAKIKLDFFTRWHAQVQELALEVATFDCNYQVEDALQACEKHFSHSITTGVDEGLWHDGLNDATTLDQYLEKAKESIFKICRPSALKTAIDVVSVKLAAAKNSRDLHGDKDEGRHAAVEDIATKLGRAKVTQAECLMLVCCRDFADTPLKLKRNIKIHLSNLSSKESSLIPKGLMRIFEEKADVKRKAEPK
ncbi:unnamed protein product, partial [Prorocentrum cordatum]